MNVFTRILIVDDDDELRDLIGAFLNKHGFEVGKAASAAEMRQQLGRTRFDLIVLDLKMPGEDGLSALRRLQQENQGPPVIMLSAVGTDIDRIVGLEMGADDYLTKPCNPRELLARIRTVLRRSQADDEGIGGADEAGEEPGLRFAGWRLDPTGYLLFNPSGRQVTMSAGELRLLRAFVEHPRRILTRGQLLNYAKGPDSEHYDRAIDMQVSRLRRHLGKTKADGDFIRTVRSEGYMFMATVT